MHGDDRPGAFDEEVFTPVTVGAPGEVVADIGGESYTLTAGESVTFDSRLAHPYRNASEQPAHLIIAVTPPTP